ncbi:hypothetical protein [Streptomyces sp. NPDC001744]|uniref:hypothetical protein n=1 Tax=Streptomyces sp. NPDC001744 TaxID=3364606 RepID=UPI0036AF3638
MGQRPRTGTDEPEEAEGTKATKATETAERTEPAGKAEGSGRRKIDLSMAQVSGSALAAVVAAKLASTLGVYGTIVGAGVISVIATCGGPFFQYALRRTGEQVRDVTTAARPKARRIRLVTTTSPDGDDRTLLLRTVPAPGAETPGGEDFGEATTHGTRVRGWRRPVVAAALVFGVTMGGITTYELVAGEDFGGRQGATTFGSAVRGDGGTEKKAPAPGGETTPAPSGTGDGTGRPEDGGASSAPGTVPTPGDGGSGRPDPGRSGTGSPSAEPSPSGSTGSGTTPPPEPTGPTTGPTAPTGEPSTGTGPSGAPAPPSPPETRAPAGPGTGTEPGDE